MVAVHSLQFMIADWKLPIGWECIHAAVMMLSIVPCMMKQTVRHPFPDEHRLWGVLHAAYLRQALSAWICCIWLSLVISHEAQPVHILLLMACQTTLSSSTCNLGCSFWSALLWYICWPEVCTLCRSKFLISTQPQELEGQWTAAIGH